jgi:hypothetical protein
MPDTKKRQGEEKESEQRDYWAVMQLVISWPQRRKDVEGSTVPEFVNERL